MQDSISSLLSSVVALIISIVALIYTIKSYLLKAGEKVRCSYTTTSSIASDDDYVSSITLENLKDKAIVIFKIYLKIGTNYFIELERFEESPLILKPFEAYQQNYDPLICYSVSGKRIELNKLLKDKSVKKKIVLATTNGKYEVETNIKRWDAVLDFFKNHLTAIIQINRLSYKGKSYGLNVKYLIEFIHENDKTQVVPIYDKDVHLVKFSNFQLTESALKNKDALLDFLLVQKEEGKVNFENVEIIDFQSESKLRYDEYNNNVIEAKYYGRFQYSILGRLLTIRDNLHLKYHNYKINKRNKV